MLLHIRLVITYALSYYNITVLRTTMIAMCSFSTHYGTVVLWTNKYYLE
jgi:hypothetical protein